MDGSVGSNRRFRDKLSLVFEMNGLLSACSSQLRADPLVVKLFKGHPLPGGSRHIKASLFPLPRALKNTN